MKNVKDLLTQAAAYPRALEARLPEALPRLSTMMLETANKVPVLMDFPVELPNLPAPPAIPELPAGLGALGKRYVTGAEVTPLTQTEIIPSPAAGVIPVVITRRGM